MRLNTRFLSGAFALVLVATGGFAEGSWYTGVGVQSITVVPDSGVPVQEGNLALGISLIGARPLGFMYRGSFTPPLSVDAYDGFVSASNTFGVGYRSEAAGTFDPFIGGGLHGSFVYAPGGIYGGVGIGTQAGFELRISDTFGLYAIGFFALDPVLFDINTSPGAIDELSRQHFAGFDVGIVRRLPRRE